MPQALVIGGSLGGLLAANLLRSIGWQAQVFERVGHDLAAPGTPGAVVERLNRDINRVLAMPDVRACMTERETLPAGGSPAQFEELVRSEVAKWQEIIRRAKLSPG